MQYTLNKPCVPDSYRCNSLYRVIHVHIGPCDRKRARSRHLHHLHHLHIRQDGWAEVGDVKQQRAGTGATTDARDRSVSGVWEVSSAPGERGSYFTPQPDMFQSPFSGPKEAT